MHTAIYTIVNSCVNRMCDIVMMYTDVPKSVVVSRIVLNYNGIDDAYNLHYAALCYESQ